MPTSILMVVDLPAPLGPMKATRSPSSTVKVTSFTACVSRRAGRKSARRLPRSPGCFSLVTKVLVSPCTWMVVKGVLLAGCMLRSKGSGRL